MSLLGLEGIKANWDDPQEPLDLRECMQKAFELWDNEPYRPQPQHWFVSQHNLDRATRKAKELGLQDRELDQPLFYLMIHHIDGNDETREWVEGMLKEYYQWQRP